MKSSSYWLAPGMPHVKYDPITAACMVWKVSREEIMSRKRTGDIALARQAIMWFYICFCFNSSKMAAKKVERKRGAATHAKKTINNFLEVDADIASKVKEFSKMIK